MKTAQTTDAHTHAAQATHAHTDLRDFNVITAAMMIAIATTATINATAHHTVDETAADMISADLAIKSATATRLSDTTQTSAILTKTNHIFLEGDRTSSSQTKEHQR